MDRHQFCEMLKNARAMSGMSLTETAYKMGKSVSSLTDILSGRKDMRLDRVFELLKAIDFKIDVTFEDENFEIVQIPEVTNFIKAIYPNITNKKFAEVVGCSVSSAYEILHGGNMRLSIFLTLVSEKNLPVYLTPKQIPDYSPDTCDIDI